MKKLLKLAGFFLIGGVFGALAVPLFLKDKPDLSGFNPLAMAAAFLLAFLGQVVVHELGHFLFGKLAGMKFYSFRVGFLALERENDQLKFKLYKNLGYLGLCIMIPTRLEPARKDLMLFMLGGLFLNLVSFLASLLLIFYGNLGPGFGTYLVYATALISFILFVSNVLPQKTSGNLHTDGQYLYDGLKKNPNYYHLQALFSLNAFSMSGMAPSAFMPRFLHRHQQTDNPTVKVNYLLYEYYYHLDQDNVEEAVQAITTAEPYLDQYPATQRKEIQKDLVFTYGFLQPHPEKARFHYNEIKTRLETSHTADSYRAKAVYALCLLQDRHLAQEYIQKGQQVAGKSVMKSFIPLEMKLLAALEKASQPALLAEA